MAFGRDARVKAARAGHVGHDFGVEEVLDGGEEFVVRGSVLHQVSLSPDTVTDKRMSCRLCEDASAYPFLIR